MAARCAAKREFGVNAVVASPFLSAPILTPFRSIYKMQAGFDCYQRLAAPLGGTT
jgi:hypothetical protein